MSQKSSPTYTLSTTLAEGRLIRGTWADTDDDGRQLLCLYTALVGDPGARPYMCPAHLAPPWLAHLLPWIDDSGTAEHWPDVVARVARLAPSFSSLPPEVEYQVRALCVRHALSYVPEGGHVAACEAVIALCDRAAGGDMPSRDEWTAAAAAAAAARAAAWTAEEAEVAAWTAAAAARAAASPATAAAAARAAFGAAALATFEAAASPATSAAADRLIDAILDTIEKASRQ